MKTTIYTTLSFLIGFALYVTFFAPSPTLLSPLGNTRDPKIKNLESNSYIVLGFAPYWNLKKLSPESLESITHFAYFNLHLNGDGSIYTKINKREEDPGYTNYKRLVSGSINYGSKALMITLMPESQTALTTMIATDRNRSATIKTIIDVLIESNASGVNVDFEPLGDIAPSTRNNFTKFIQKLHTQLDGLDKLLTISVYGSAAVKPRIWDLSELAPFTDHFVIMTYDYTMPGSLIAGPNSPLRGSGDLFEHDIINNIAQITKLVDSRKVLLGIPFYGYEWDTVDSSKYSPVEDRGSVASLERIQKMLDDLTLELVWDRNTLTPYGIASESGQTSQIYFENPASMRLKMQFVKSARLGGVAIWALGYEGSGSWVWPVINELNK